jgi:hypothetical protein
MFLFLFRFYLSYVISLPFENNRNLYIHALQKKQVLQIHLPIFYNYRGEQPLFFWETAAGHSTSVDKRWNPEKTSHPYRRYRNRSLYRLASPIFVTSILPSYSTHPRNPDTASKANSVSRVPDGDRASSSTSITFDGVGDGAMLKFTGILNDRTEKIKNTHCYSSRSFSTTNK